MQPFWKKITGRSSMNKAELIDSIASEADISKQEARKGRNPQTGKEIKIPAK